MELTLLLIDIHDTIDAWPSDCSSTGVNDISDGMALAATLLSRPTPPLHPLRLPPWRTRTLLPWVHHHLCLPTFSAYLPSLIGGR